MSRLKLDRNRKYGVVYGDEEDNPTRPRKFYQDGMYFDGAGNAIEGSAPTKHVPPPTADPVKVVEPESNSDLVAQLQDMSVPKLKKAAKAINEANGAELPVMSGAGVKARLVAYISEHAEL